MKIKIQTKSKTNNFYEAVGISDKRATEILVLVKDCEREGTTKSGTLQLIADRVKDVKELSIASFWYGRDGGRQETVEESSRVLSNQIFSACLDVFVFFFALMGTIIAIFNFPKMWYFLPFNLLVIGVIMWQRRPWRT